jgi:hypothetical protein
MKKILSLFFLNAIFLSFVSCEKDKDTDLSLQLTGQWRQEQLFIDDVPQPVSQGELNTTLLMDANGIYRLFDGVRNQIHQGTWLFSDGDWLNMSMDKRNELPNKDGTYSFFGQVLVRFTILRADSEYLELRIKTYLYERKLTVMFNYMDPDDTTGMTGEELLMLDAKNKELHTYRYVFKKNNL